MVINNILEAFPVQRGLIKATKQKRISKCHSYGDTGKRFRQQKFMPFANAGDWLDAFLFLCQMLGLLSGKCHYYGDNGSSMYTTSHVDCLIAETD